VNKSAFDTNRKGEDLMIEYFLHWWGGCEPYVKKNTNIKENYLYFSSEHERKEVINLLLKYNKYGLALDKKNGDMAHKKTIAEIGLKYKDKEYFYEDDFGYEYPSESVEFQYKENNYSCDCNRSLFIQRYCDENFPELNCGDKIKLIHFKVKTIL